MSRIDRAFSRAREQNRAALIPFVTCGDPDLDTTAELIPELEAAGADIVELGFPHSDPIAEGPTIQAASLRALQHGSSLSEVLDVVKRVRESCEVPLVLMGYLNNVLAYGTDALVGAAADNGVDGLIVVDAPYEETRDLHDACAARGVDRVLLIAPTSTPERVVRIAAASAGFVYCVSATGVTGERRALPADLEQMVARIQRVTKTPVAVGFGISTPDQAADVARFADGVVVGSALVRQIGEASSPSEVISTATRYVSSLRAAIETARKSPKS